MSARWLALGVLLAVAAPLGASEPGAWPLARASAWWRADHPAAWAGQLRPLGLSLPPQAAGSCLSLDGDAGVVRLLGEALSGKDGPREAARKAATSDLAGVRWLTLRRAMPEVADYFDDELHRAETAVAASVSACRASLDSPADLPGQWRAAAVREAWRQQSRSRKDPGTAEERAEGQRDSSGRAADQAYARLGTLDALVALGWRNLDFDLRQVRTLFADQAGLTSWLRGVLGGPSGDSLPGHWRAGTGLFPDWERLRGHAEQLLHRQWEGLRSNGRVQEAELAAWGLAPGFMAPLARQERGVADSAMAMVARELATLRLARKVLFARRVLVAARGRGEVVGNPAALRQAGLLLGSLDAEWRGLREWAELEARSRGLMERHLAALPRAAGHGPQQRR